MNLWTLIKSWFAQPDPLDAETTYPSPDGTQPIPSDFFVPGESQRINAPPDDQPCQDQTTR